MKNSVLLSLSLFFLLPFAVLSQDGSQDEQGGTNSLNWGEIQESSEQQGATSIAGDHCNDYLVSTFDGGNFHNGNMFDLVARDTLMIHSFEGNLLDTGTVAIFYKEGSYQGYAQTDTAWTFIDSAYVVSNGSGVPTEIPIDVRKDMAPGDTLAFYVTMTGGANKDLSYTDGSSLGSVHSSNSYLELLEGAGLGYPFGNTSSPRIWNGIINYCPETSTSTEEFAVNSAQELRIHPNPSDGRFRVSFSSEQSQEMVVRDARGRVVHRKENVGGQGRTEESLDLSHLPNGLYHLQLVSDKGSANKKLIIR